MHNTTVMILITIVFVISLGVMMILIMTRKRSMGDSESVIITGGRKRTTEPSTSVVSNDISPPLPTDVPNINTAVHTISNAVIQSIPMSKFVWLEKTDGIRTVLLIENGTMYDITDVNHITILQTSISNPHCIKRTIIESEAYETIYIGFDAFMIESTELSSLPYIDRFAKATTFINTICNDLPIVSASCKPVTSWKDLIDFLKYERSPTTKRIIDGIIIQRVDTPIMNTSNVITTYKLKSPSLNTIDFYVKYVKSEGVYYLYLYGNDTVYRTACRRIVKTNLHMIEHTGNDPTRRLPNRCFILFASPFYSSMSKFKPRIDWDQNGYHERFKLAASSMMKDMLSDPMKYDGKIIELSFANDGWVPFRIRTDKTLPNSYVIGFSNVSILFNPITVNATYFAVSSTLSTDNAIVVAYHECSHVMRQYVIERVLGNRKKRILDDNRDMFMSKSNVVSGGSIEDIYNLQSTNDQELPNSGNAELPSTIPINGYQDVSVVSTLMESTDSTNVLGTLVSSIIRPSKMPQRLIMCRASAQLSCLDLAGGRGADVSTLLNLGVTNLFGVDADRDALVKYAIRRMTHVAHDSWKPLLTLTKQDNHHDSYLNIIAYTLSSNNSQLIKLITTRSEYPRLGFDFIIMNYAIHYLCYSHKVMKELGLLISSVINKTHGFFIVTYVDGDRVLEMMNGNRSVSVKPFMIDLVDFIDADDDSRSMYHNHDTDMQLVKMPLPTIDSKGYRIEPLVTNQWLSDLDEFLNVEEEFNIIDAAKRFIEPITNQLSVTGYLSLFKARVYGPRHR